MNKLRILTLATLLLALFAFPISALAAPAMLPAFDDVVVFGNDYQLAAGETVVGSVIVFGGDITIEATATVTGDVISFGGDIESNGSVNGSVIALGGDVNLGDSAVVNGDVVTPGGDLNQAAGAQVIGNTFTDTRQFNFEFPRFNPPNTPHFDFFDHERGLVARALWLLFNSFAISTMALLVALFLPEHLRRVSDAILAEPLTSGGLGLLSLILLPMVLLITVITIIGPFILGFAAVVAVAVGWIALGLEVGRRMAIGTKTNWSPLIQAWIGTLILSFAGGLLGWVPCIGWLGQLLLASLGLGGVLLTRFGTRSYPLVVAAAARKTLPPSAPRKRASK